MPGRSQGTILQAYRVRSLVLRFDLSVLPYFLRSFLGPHRAGVPGRLVPVGSDCARWRSVVSRGSAYPRSETRVGVESSVWPGLPVREAVRRRARVGSERCSSSVRPSSRRGGPKSEAGVVPPRLGLLVRDWIILLAYHLSILGQPMSCALFTTLSAGPSLCWKADP